MTNIVELREISNEKIEELLEDGREEMFNLRFQNAAKRVGNPMRVRDVRRDAARLKSVLHNRQLAIETAAALPAIASALGQKEEWQATANFVYEESGWAVAFESDGSEIATALVDLNKKQPKGRRGRAQKSAPERVLKYDIK